MSYQPIMEALAMTSMSILSSTAQVASASSSILDAARMAILDDELPNAERYDEIRRLSKAGRASADLHSYQCAMAWNDLEKAVVEATR